MATEPRRPGGVIGWRRALRGLAVAGAAAAGGGAFAQQPMPLPTNLTATPVAAQPANLVLGKHLWNGEEHRGFLSQYLSSTISCTACLLPGTTCPW